MIGLWFGSIWNEPSVVYPLKLSTSVLTNLPLEVTILNLNVFMVTSYQALLASAFAMTSSMATREKERGFRKIIMLALKYLLEASYGVLYLYELALHSCELLSNGKRL